MKKPKSVFGLDFHGQQGSEKEFIGGTGRVPNLKLTKSIK